MADKQTAQTQSNQSIKDAGRADNETTEVSSEELDAAAEGDWVAQESPSYEDLEAALAEAHRISDDFNERLLRAHSEMENLRRRTERELENAHKYALERIAGELLTVRDSLEMGLDAAGKPGVEVASLSEGMILTLKQLATLMEKHGIKEINPVNEKFKPELHQAMTVQATSSVEPNTVLTVFQKGYALNDRLLRPAMVVVSKAPPSAGGNNPEGGKVDETA